MFIIYGILVTLGLIFGFFFTKGHAVSVESTKSDKVETASFIECVKICDEEAPIVAALKEILREKRKEI